MNQVFLSDSCYVYFGTSSVSTGAATDADSTPTVAVAEDGTDLAYAPTVTNVATGLYKAQIDATAANGFEAGRRYNVYAVATVGAITGRDGVGEFEVLTVDLNTGVASVQGNVTGSVASVTGAVGSVTGAVGSVTGAVGSVTAAVTLPTIPADWITAAGIAADAGTEIGTAVWASATRQLTGTQTFNVTGNITGNLSGSVGSVTGLTAANLDTTISSRMATYAQPTGFLTATFPATVASTTNITAGTITTTTNLTNLPAITTNWLTADGLAADAVAEIQSGLSTLTQANIRSAVGLASANLDTQLDTLPTAAEIVAAQLTTAITEAYRANGAAPSLAEFMSEVLAHLGEASITGTVKTVNKLDHITEAATFTLNSATSPTSVTRAT